MKGRAGMARCAIFVTGPPASGKSKVAEFLAGGLPDFALLQKDNLKEELFQGPLGGDLEAARVSRRFSDAAIQLLWSLAPKCPRVIVEANFRTREFLERERFMALNAEKLEVHCWCPFEVALRRFADRAGKRHPAHTVKNLTREVYEESEASFGLGPLMQVDTTKPVDLAEVTKWVRGLWPDV